MSSFWGKNFQSQTGLHSESGKIEVWENLNSIHLILVHERLKETFQVSVISVVAFLLNEQCKPSLSILKWVERMAIREVWRLLV